jgi:hypothetical protein
MPGRLTMRRHLYYYTVVDVGFEPAAALLQGDPSRWLPSPTAGRDGWLVQLHAHGALPRPIADHTATVEVGAPSAGPNSLLVPLSWRSASADRLVPVLSGELELGAMAGDGVHLSLLADYHPPLSVLGATGDLLAGRRIAEASVRRFVLDVAVNLVDSGVPGRDAGARGEEAAC